jgi:hypothetical protein
MILSAGRAGIVIVQMFRQAEEFRSQPFAAQLSQEPHRFVVCRVLRQALQTILVAVADFVVGEPGDFGRFGRRARMGAAARRFQAR